MRKKMRNRNYIFMTMCVCTLFLSACNRNSGPPNARAVQEIPVFAVNTTLAAHGPIQNYLALSGDLVAGSSVDAYPDTAGRITRVLVSTGSVVRRNQTIAYVDPSRPGMDFLPSPVLSPIAGTIVSLPAQVGMTVSQSVPVAKVAGGSALEIRLHVAERFISKMALRLPCEITLDAYPGEIFRGTINEISPTVDPVSRTMEVRVNVDNPGSRLKAGMFAKVRVITERKDDIVKIPASAMIQRFGENYIFAVETDSRDPAFMVARRKLIKPGIIIDGIMEVQEGLNPNDEIVVRGQTLLEDGSRIKVIDRIAGLN